VKNKIIPIAVLVVVFSLGFLYLNQNYLTANDKEGKTCAENSGCTDKSSCTKKSSSERNNIKAGGEWNSYEFVTDKACCEEMKTDLQKELLGVAGVKEVKFSGTCNVSKMTQVTVYYSAGETSQDNIASYLKDKKFDCTGKECDGKGCTKDGVKSGEKSGSKENGCDGNKECPHKEKTKDSKNL
jgi:hypothetical protein